MVLLGYREREAWRKTPYQIVTLFKYYKEYSQPAFAPMQAQAAVPKKVAGGMDAIDIALGGL